jgi:DNA-binding response OmpR family regulator
VLDWAAELGADEVLPKPFAPQALVEAVETQLRLAPAQAVVA